MKTIAELKAEKAEKPNRIPFEKRSSNPKNALVCSIHFEPDIFCSGCVKESIKEALSELRDSLGEITFYNNEFPRFTKVVELKDLLKAIDSRRTA